MVVDADMDVFPADATAAALSRAVTGDAVARAVEAAELLDVDVREFAGFVALIARHRLDRLQVFPAVQAVALEDPADGGRGDTGLGGDLGGGAALAAQREDLLTDCLGRRLARPAGTVGYFVLEAVSVIG